MEKRIINRCVRNFGFVYFIVCLWSCGSGKKEELAPNDVQGGFNSIFFDIKDIKIPSKNPDSLEQATKHMESLNLEGSEAFWPGHDHFFMNSIGSIEFPKEGSYSFRLLVSGKIKLKLNNKDLFDLKTPKDTILENLQFVDAGSNLFEIEYFDGGLNPKIVLEWINEGGASEVIPKERIHPADLSLNAEPYEKAAMRPLEESTQSPNTLSPDEIKKGWKLLFDGTTTKGWHTYNKPGTIGRKWHAEEGTLTFDGRNRFIYKFEGRMNEMGDTDKVKDGGEDILTDGEYENFELMLEWKISEGGNNGIIYSVLEDKQYKDIWNTSPEMQVLDDFVHKDGLIYKHRSGDLYDLIACKEIAVRPQGQWNQVKIVKNKGKVEHWLNGIKVVEYDTNSTEWTEMIKKSKFSNLTNFGTQGKRKIGFQDHDNQVWYRNIKIVELK